MKEKDPGEALWEFFSSGTTISLLVVLVLLVVVFVVLLRLRRTLFAPDDKPVGEDLTMNQARRMRERGQIDNEEFARLKQEIARRSKERLDQTTPGGPSSR